MGFFNFGGGGARDDEEKVIEITSRGKSAMKAGNVDGLELDILDHMKGGAPTTVEKLSEDLNQKYGWVRTNCKSLVRKKYIEVVS